MALAKGSSIIAGDRMMLSFNTIEEMKSFTALDGLICYVDATGGFYGYSSKNAANSILGQWRKFTLTETA